MAKYTMDDQAEAPESGRTRGTTQPMVILPRPRPIPEIWEGSAEAAPEIPEKPAPTYIPTRWLIVNRALDLTDSITGGKAVWIQRLFTYLMVGGFAALVNLATFAFFYEKFRLPFNDHVFAQHVARYMIAFLIATEVSIMANFIPNDRITFSHLPGHSRSWVTRALRFHLTCVAGTLLTLAISFSLHLFSVQAVVAQAIALIVVTGFNFTMHHVFTYRHIHVEEPSVL